MIRGLRWAASAAVLFAIQGGIASAQYYPPGYGGFGWGGWGGGAGGGSTVQGDVARGMGVFAAGAGVYNEKTAVATSINANTAMHWNEYLFESQQATNRRYHEQMARDRNAVNKTAEAVYKRLHDNPTEGDIMRGDALNVALDEITAPKVYSIALRGAKQPFPGVKIREIPFQYAAQALTTSVDNLTNGPPPLLDAPEFQADRAALRALRVRFNALSEANKPIDHEIVKEAQGHIKSMGKILKDNPGNKYKKGSDAYRAAETYLKGLYGLVTMLETPAINVLLAGVDKRPDTTLSDLLGFMQSFNLRFGQAKTAAQRQVYSELFPLLDSLRDELVKGGLPPTSGQKPDPSHPGQFFNGMEYEHLDAKPKTPVPPAPSR
jgi:hypothetical protein